MPTGYTADIAKGITFRQYALGCARAFGALIMMRDDPADAPIPERFEPSKWHAERLQEASDRLARLKLMNSEECIAAAHAANAEAVRNYEDRKKERDELRAKYEAMLAQVVAWQAPTPDHIEYKTFMEKQIRDSIDFDCRDYCEQVIPLTGAQWLEKELKRAEWDVGYHTKHDAEERQRTEGRNAWIKALRDSLP